MNDEGSSVKFTDIIEFKPELIQVIHDTEISKLIIDDLYLPILKVLRKGPMTVKEIEKEYNKIANSPKSDKTLYRYLKTLQDANLVKTAGQRVISGKTATEKLFSRTAYAFHLVNEQIDFWQTSDGIKLTNTLGTILQPLIPNKKVNIEKLGQFIEKLSSERINMLEQMLSTSDPSLIEGISNYNWQRFTLFYNLGGLFGLLLTDPHKVTDLTKCFE
tara:strand:+ start:202 stop:852 length:651 start_codon:yes stop_codon:yes gene_type:complete